MKIVSTDKYCKIALVYISRRSLLQKKIIEVVQ